MPPICEFCKRKNERIEQCPLANVSSADVACFLGVTTSSVNRLALSG